MGPGVGAKDRLPTPHSPTRCAGPASLPDNFREIVASAGP
jgi:hypothetical protein